MSLPAGLAPSIWECMAHRDMQPSNEWLASAAPVVDYDFSGVLDMLIAPAAVAGTHSVTQSIFPAG